MKGVSVKTLVTLVLGAGAIAFATSWYLKRKRRLKYVEQEVFSLKGVGWNGFGQLGTGDVSFCENFTEITAGLPHDLHMVCAGGLHYGCFDSLLFYFV